MLDTYRIHSRGFRKRIRKGNDRSSTENSKEISPISFAHYPATQESCVCEKQVGRAFGRGRNAYMIRQI